MSEMHETAAAPAPATLTSHRPGTRWMAILVIAFVWIELISQLKAEWWLNPQYNYGLIVPLLVGYLFWRRWQNRPNPEAPGARAVPILILAAFAALFLPIRFLADANPDWRMLSWLLATVVVAIS
ncbi:MAG TPA: archaeosortase/exosortase family protein, partial [Chthoniobacterales bacterium]|nr:archaeosortase/exosortase family protein [Chthoniobacterales bacterium]